MNQEYYYEIYDTLENDDSENLDLLLGGEYTIDMVFEYLPQKFDYGRYPIPLINAAAEMGAYNCVCYLIESGVNLDVEDGFGNKPLHAAAASYSSDIFEYLHGAGADIYAINNMGSTILHIASRYGDELIVDYLLNGYSDVNQVDSENKNALYIACMFDHLSIVEKLLEAGSEIVDDCRGNSCLHAALQYGSINTSIFLLSHRIFDLNQVNSLGRTVLLESALTGAIDVFEKLFNLGSNISIQDIYGNTVTHLAAASKNYFILHFLKTKNALQLSVQNRSGMTPIHLAAIFGQPESVRELSTPATIIDTWCGFSPLYLSAKHGHLNATAFLLSQGGSSVFSVMGQTALHAASMQPKSEIVEFLCRSRMFDINYGDRLNMTPLHFAALYSSKKTVEILISYGARKEIKDLLGRTPFDLANKRGASNIASILV